MAIVVSYPGVYIEELSSGVRTIVGVATSITAFVGRAVRGPVDDPGTIFSWGDFERLYGGLASEYPMSYAVRDFFLNGGTQAVIVRLYLLPVPESGVPDPDTANGSATVLYSGLALKAANPGKWGESLSVEVNYNGIEESEIGHDAHVALYKRYNLQDKDNVLFNLVIRDKGTGQSELIPTVTYEEGTRRIDRVLQQESALVRLNAVPAPGAPRPEVSPPDPNNDNKPTQTKFEHGWDSQTTGSAVLQRNNSNQGAKTGLYLLDKVDLFNLLCIPPDVRDDNVPVDFLSDAMEYCWNRRAMLIVDSQAKWGDVSKGIEWLGTLGLTSPHAHNAALFYPRVKQADPLSNGQIDIFVPCGIIAGVIASTDAKRGVWKAPAGIDDGVLNGIQGLQFTLSDQQNGALNPLGINCLRSFPITGPVIWGARTLRGADILSDEYKYIPVRRTALFIEESLYRGLQWVVFEPNDEPLWAQIRLNVGGFMQTLFRQGAFQGASPRDAYFVKCDGETTTQNDINLGIVNIVVGFAPLKPAEFVVIGIQQMAGQIEV